MRPGQTSSSSCLGPTLAAINRPGLCLWPLFSNWPLFLEAKWLWLSVRRSFSRPLPHLPFLSLSFSLCRDLNPSATVSLSHLARVWSLDRNWRGERAPQRVDQLIPVTLWSEPFHDIFLVKTRVCGASDRKVRICNWSSHVPTGS